MFAYKDQGIVDDESRYANVIEVSCVRAKGALSLHALSCNTHGTVQKAVKTFNITAASPNVLLRVQLGNPADVISASRRSGTLIFGLIVGLWPVSLVLGLVLTFSAKSKKDRSSIAEDVSGGKVKSVSDFVTELSGDSDAR